MHQDGYGTVDSGHYVVSGYNEVVMLCRLPQQHKEEACKILFSSTGASSKVKQPEFDLTSINIGSHDDGWERPDWPHINTIEQWKAMK